MNNHDKEELSSHEIRWKNPAKWCRITLRIKGYLYYNVTMGYLEN
ncbi:MAG: hypothetical protein NZ853_06545 [Leptospiraceae bacterium]|nr:hypothetical protein [Leptospiraceae bacterium]